MRQIRCSQEDAIFGSRISFRGLRGSLRIDAGLLASGDWAAQSDACILRILHGRGEIYPRGLLTAAPSPTSVEDLRTFSDGILCSTLREAAARRGSLADDEAWEGASDDASQFSSSENSRQFFAYVAEPLQLRTSFRDAIAEDVRHAAGRPRTTKPCYARTSAPVCPRQMSPQTPVVADAPMSPAPNYA